MKFFGRIPLILSSFAALHLAHAKSPTQDKPEWVSIYSGSETNFSNGDRKRVLAVLEAFGVDHEVAPNREILVPAANRFSTQDLVARVIHQVNDVPAPGTHSHKPQVNEDLLK